MPDEPPTTISPAAAEALQGIYAGAQSQGLQIVGLSNVVSIEDALTGSMDNPVNLGLAVEISVALDASGKPIPRIEDRTEFQPASAVMTIRVAPHHDLGGDFFGAHVRVVDVETSRIIYAGSSGPTAEDWEELRGGRDESEYMNDPEFAAGLLALEATTVEEAVQNALSGGTGGAGMSLDHDWQSAASATSDEQADASAVAAAGVERADGATAGGTDGAGTRFPGGWLGIAAAAGGLAAIVALVLVTSGGGAANEGDGDANGGLPAATTSAFATSTPSGSTAAATDVPLNACQTLQQQQLALELTSPDVQPTIPVAYSRSVAYPEGFPTPRLAWSAVPDAATEIAVLILTLTPERAAAYEGDPNLWWGDGGRAIIPAGSVRWTLTGLDPIANSLARTSLDRPPPDGAIEHPTSSVAVDVDGQSVNNKFVGPDIPGRYFLFAVFALCDPVHGQPDDFSPGWLQRYSVATGWFISTSAW